MAYGSRYGGDDEPVDLHAVRQSLEDLQRDVAPDPRLAKVAAAIAAAVVALEGLGAGRPPAALDRLSRLPDGRSLR